MENKFTYKISFSEYQSYLNCPHKWFLSYILKFPTDSSEELLFGSALHNTIEESLTNKFLNKYARDNKNFLSNQFVEELKKQLERIEDVELLTRFKNAWLLPLLIKQGRALITELNFFEKFKDYEVVDVEFRLDDMLIISKKEYDITYKGFIDLVLKHKVTGRYLILDWKTSRKAWDIDKKEKDINFYNQLKLYKYFYSVKKEISMDNIDLCFYNLPREESGKQKMYNKNISKDEVDLFMKEFSNNCVRIIESDLFTHNKAKFLSPKNFCHRCNFNGDKLCNDIDEFQNILINAEK